jgi:hypothetical protein
LLLPSTSWKIGLFVELLWLIRNEYVGTPKHDSGLAILSTRQRAYGERNKERCFRACCSILLKEEGFPAIRPSQHASFAAYGSTATLHALQ